MGYAAKITNALKYIYAQNTIGLQRQESIDPLSPRSFTMKPDSSVSAVYIALTALFVTKALCRINIGCFDGLHSYR